MQRAPLTRSSLLVLAGFFAAVVLMLALTWLPALAQAAEAPVSLNLVPVGQSNGYFALTMKPGETRDLTVDLVNGGATSVAARSYAADVYTIVNGGFGAKTAADSHSGTTGWVDFPTTVQELAPGQTAERAVTVTVPQSVVPGEYISSLVIENAEPTTAATDSGLAQTIRTAVAVSIRVPGAAHSAIRIGTARESRVDGRSMIGVGVANTGDLLLKPTAILVVEDSQGSPVGRFRVAMGSFYPHTSTEVEVRLPATLAAGGYSVDLQLADSSNHLKTENDSIPFVVAGVATATPIDGHDRPLALLFAGIATSLLLGAVVIAFIAVAKGRRRELIEGEQP